MPGRAPREQGPHLSNPVFRGTGGVKAVRHLSPMGPPTQGTGGVSCETPRPSEASKPKSPSLVYFQEVSAEVPFPSPSLCLWVWPPAVPCRAERREVRTYVSERGVRSRTGPGFFQVLAPVKADFLHARTLFCQKTENRQKPEHQSYREERETRRPPTRTGKS